MKIMIRPYSERDKNDLLNILRLNTPQYFDESEEKEYVEYLEKELEDYFVVEIEGKIVGAGGINYFFEEYSARISWDLIHPAYQGRGIGRSLLNHRINRIKENPTVKTIIVRTSQEVYKFYEKSGFVLKEIRGNFWAEGFDLYYMELANSD